MASWIQSGFKASKPDYLTLYLVSTHPILLLPTCPTDQYTEAAYLQYLLTYLIFFFIYIFHNLLQIRWLNCFYMGLLLLFNKSSLWAFLSLRCPSLNLLPLNCNKTCLCLGVLHFQFCRPTLFVTPYGGRFEVSSKHKAANEDKRIS